MHLRLRLLAPDATRDLVISCEPETPAGDVATAVLGDDRAVVLAAAGRNARQPRIDTPIGECDVRSGDLVELTTPSPDTTDDDVGSPEPAGPASLLVVEGPDAGRSFPLRYGSNTIGRSPTCWVRLSDPSVASLHGRVIIGDEIEIADCGSPNGIEVDGATILGAARVIAGASIQLGDTRLLVDRAPVGHNGPHRADPAVAFNPPPRIFAPYAGRLHSVPAPPPRPARQHLPWLSALVPVLMAGVFWVMTQSVLTVAFLALSPLFLVGAAIEGRRHARQDHAEALADHAVELDEVEGEIRAAHALEREHRGEEAPTVDRLVPLAIDRGFRMWERDASADDVLALRIGTATLPSRSTINIADCPRRAARHLERRFAPLQQVTDAPLVTSLAHVGSIGIAGGDAATAVARSLVLQAATLHSPDHLTIAAMLTDDAAAAWGWLKWLPHVRPPRPALPGPLLTTSATATTSLLDRLEALLHERASTDEGHGPTRRTLLVIAERAVTAPERVAEVLDRAPAAGVHVIFVARGLRALPAAVGAVAVIGDADSSWYGETATGERISPVRVEPLAVTDAERAARALAPVVDVTSRRPRGADVPRHIALRGVLGVDAPECASDVARRWAHGRGLRATLGETAIGALSVDLRSDGPHALVAGTTGAGKSELLQTLVASLAITHSPERVTFLLVDYKGGAAFKECVDLPHCVGLVTDLNRQLVRRALISLDAEVTRRERLLAAAGAKDLQDMEARGLHGAPPSLVIVVDEFAALAREIPEFVDGVVNIAQRGRSLGLHLVLATQRPAGVITDNIRANTNLRIALRVAEIGESTDVIGVADAAALDRATPGRAVARVGPRELVEFQTAYVGGVSTGRPAPTITVAPFDLDQTGAAIASDAPVAPLTSSGESDLQRLVALARSAAAQHRIAAPHRPWIDPLPPILALDVGARETAPGVAVIGLLDDPAEQTQGEARLDFGHDGSVLVFGTSRSGKTVLLRTLAASLAGAAEPVWVYGLDGGGRGLAPIETLPIVGSVVTIDDQERTLRLLRLLAATIDRRRRVLADRGAADLVELRRVDPRHANEPRIVLLVDGYPAFRSAYEEVERGEAVDLLTRIVADGRSTGIHAVLTTDRRAGIAGEVASLVSTRVVLRLADADEYASLDVATDAIAGDAPPGRGLLNGSELQVALVGGAPSGDAQVAAIAGLARRLDATTPEATPAPPIRRLPADIRIAQLAGSVGSPEVPLGIGADALAAFGIDVRDRHLCIFGPARSGRSSTLATIATGVAAQDPTTRRILLSHREPTTTAPWSEWLRSTAEIEAVIDPPHRSVAERGAAVVVFVDDVTDGGDALDDALAELVRRSRMQPIHLVVAGDAYAARRSYGVLGELRSAKHGLLLQPDLDNDGDIFGVRLPRALGVRMPAGRGLLVDGSHVELVQVARP